jgi:hypothetical protein
VRRRREVTVLDTVFCPVGQYLGVSLVTQWSLVPRLLTQYRRIFGVLLPKTAWPSKVASYTVNDGKCADDGGIWAVVKIMNLMRRMTVA